jgi:hypothetical protein
VPGPSHCRAFDFVLFSEGTLRTFKVSLKLRDVGGLQPGTTCPSAVRVLIIIEAGRRGTAGTILIAGGDAEAASSPWRPTKFRSTWTRIASTGVRNLRWRRRTPSSSVYGEHDAAFSPAQGANEGDLAIDVKVLFAAYKLRFRRPQDPVAGPDMHGVD